MALLYQCGCVLVCFECRADCVHMFAWSRRNIITGLSVARAGVRRLKPPRRRPNWLQCLDRLLPSSTTDAQDTVRDGARCELPMPSPVAFLFRNCCYSAICEGTYPQLLLLHQSEQRKGLGRLRIWAASAGQGIPGCWLQRSEDPDREPQSSSAGNSMGPNNN